MSSSLAHKGEQMLRINNREKYVCVEPGYVTEFKPLNPGETWIGGQTLSVIQEPRRL